ncbi:MAG: hypothetical protein V1726_02645 [Methanobacteriota archaeon]
MIKKHRILLGGQSKTGTFSILFFIIGGFLLFVYIGLMLLSSYPKEASTILAFAILFIGVGGILYFFHLQFTKLEQIAKDIECGTGDDEEPVE